VRDQVDIVDGWQVRRAEDSGFGIYAYDELIAGPFESRNQAFMEATRLPWDAVPKIDTKQAANPLLHIDDDDPEPNVGRRRVKPEIAIARNLQLGLKPIHRRMTKMQLRATFIAACLPSGRVNGPALEEEARTLIAEIANQRLEIDKLVSSMPGAKASSRLFDTRNALSRIEAALREVITAT
jgi:hypothetical protein